MTAQLLQSCDEFDGAFTTQGFKANPGLKFANAFSVMSLNLLLDLFHKPETTVSRPLCMTLDYLSVESPGVSQTK